jgi:hypothetical protein
LLALNPKQKRRLVIALICISAVYYFNSFYINTSNDGCHYALVSAWVNNGSSEISAYMKYTGNTDYATKDGKYYADRLPGTAVFMLPFYYTGKLLELIGIKSATERPITEASVIMLSNFCGVLAAVIILGLLLQFKLSFNTSFVFMLVFAFATLNWQESTHVFSHALSQLLVLLSTYYLVSTPTPFHQRGYFASLCLAISVTVELQNVLLALPMGLFYLWKNIGLLKQAQAQPHKVIYHLFIWLIPIGFLLIYNYQTFGEWMLKSNTYNPNFPEEQGYLSSLSGNFIYGLDKLFTNFNQSEVIFHLQDGIRNAVPGLFVVSPFLVLSLLGVYQFYRIDKAICLYMMGSCILLILIAATHKTVLTRHIFTANGFIFFFSVWGYQFIIEQLKSIKLKWLFNSVMAMVIAYSVFRVYYATNTYWGRDFSDIITFIQEWEVFVITWLVLALILMFIKKGYKKCCSLFNEMN